MSGVSFVEEGQLMHMSVNAAADTFGDMCHTLSFSEWPVALATHTEFSKS